MIRLLNIKKAMKYIILVWCFIAIALPVYANQKEDAQSQYKGQEVFKAKGCNECHSMNGNGGKGGPDLGRDKYYGTHLELASKMWNHFPKMQKKMHSADKEFQTITVDEMTCLIDYILFMRYCGEKGNSFRGRKLLHSMECYSCHKFGGEGGAIGPDISAIDEFISPMNLLEDMWNHGPKMIPLFEKHNISRPEFYKDDFIDIASAIQSFMTPSKVSADAYLLGDSEKGEILINEKGCLKCHSLSNTNTLGSNFNELELNYSVLEFAGRFWNHGPKMWKTMQEENIQIPTFESGDMNHIIAYIYHLKLEDKSGDDKAGYRLLTEKKCLDCHSLNGIGSNIVEKDFNQIKGMDSPVALISKLWSHAPEMDKKRVEKKLKWPKLSAQDMADLYAYFSSISH